jgi:hypothetical protein
MDTTPIPRHIRGGLLQAGVPMERVSISWQQQSHREVLLALDTRPAGTARGGRQAELAISCLCSLHGQGFRRNYYSGSVSAMMVCKA